MIGNFISSLFGSIQLNRSPTAAKLLVESVRRLHLQSEQNLDHRFSLSGWTLISVLLALGLFFRFGNLDKKIYWYDEMLTSFRIAGYSATELKERPFSTHEISVQALQKYQRINPERTLLHTIRFQAMENPQHPPLYFVLARVWAELFGDSTRAIRGLSAFLSLLVLPSLYWLCRELFDLPRIAWVAIVLTAVSPFQVLYAQEARPYSLWILMTVISSVALLRALRLDSWRSWGLYGLTLAGGIYSHLLFSLVALGHGIYVFTLEKGAFKKFLPYLVSSIVALVFFFPWAVAILFGVSRVQSATGWIRVTEVGFLDKLKLWPFVFNVGFVDTSWIYVLRASYGADTSWVYLLQLPALLLIGYSLFFIYQKAANRIWLFVLALIGSSVMPLLLSDLTLGWQISTLPRFLTPYYLGGLLSVAYLLSAKTLAPDLSQRRLWKAISVIAIASGVVSCAIISQAETWWNKGFSNPQLARVINQYHRPLLIAPLDTFVDVLSLTNVLDPKVRIRMVADPKKLIIPDGFSDIFLISSERNRQWLERSSYRIEAVYGSELWRVTKKP